MMIVAGWWLHCVMIATVLSAGALAWELSARWMGRPARWSWFAALAGSVALPWLLRLLPEQVLPAAVASVPVLTLDAIAVSNATSAPSIGAGDVAILAWLVSSTAMLFYLGVMLVRLARARRGWRSEQVDGGRVWVTRSVGPAAVGVRGEVVVPQWAMELDAELRRLLLLHEREHVHAGDPRLLLASLVLLALMPWNPVLWLQVLRLRNAIELDCDARVLRTGASPRVYGSLLLEVGSRRSSNALVMATFAEPRLFLEERIRRIARWPQQRRPLRAVLLGLLAVVLFGTAASARDPLRIGSVDLMTDEDAATSPIPGVMATDTPPPMLLRESAMTKRPALKNSREVVQALQAAYPSALRDAARGGTAQVWLLIDEQGRVQRTSLARSTGYPAMDEAVLNVAQQMLFTPAENAGRAIQTWVQVPIQMVPPGAEPKEVVIVGQRIAPPAATELVEYPREQQVRVRPELANVADVQRAMARAYPPLLRDAGITGVVKMFYYVDTNGRVQRTQVAKSSGYPAFDDAALRLAEVMQFTPATDASGKVAAWVELPIVFGDVTVEERSTSTDELTVLNEVRIVGERLNPAGSPPPPPPPTRLRESDRATMRVDGIDTVFHLPLREVAVVGSQAQQPVFTPFTTRPEVVNIADVARELSRNYPPLLRNAGIGGKAMVWFYIDESGRVTRTQLSATSGYPALDEAALRVARMIRFTPAMNRDAKVAVWFEVPIEFHAK